MPQSSLCKAPPRSRKMQEKPLPTAAKRRPSLASAPASASALALAQTRTHALAAQGEDLIRELFGSVFPRYGFIVRENQLTLALEMYRAIQYNQIALCEAGVGSGKTLAYLVATLVHRLALGDKRPTILSTPTIALQKAITEEYLPQLSEMLLQSGLIAQPLRFVVRKGKSHYACDLRLQGYLASIRHLGEDTALLERLTALQQTPYSEIDLSLYPLSRYEKDRVCVMGRCPQNCPKTDVCRYQAFLADSLTQPFDFLVTNHNYILAHILLLNESGRGLLPPYGVLVFDEAHKLLDAARTQYGKQLELAEILGLLESIPTQAVALRHDRSILKSWIDLTRARAIQLFRLLAEEADKPSNSESMTSDSADNTPRAITLRPAAGRCMRKLEDELAHLLTLCLLYGKQKVLDRVPSLREQCEETTEKLAYFREENGLIPWLEEKGGQRLCSIPEDIDRRLYQDIWKKLTPCLLTSGTLSVGGDFGLLKKSLGIQAVSAKRVAEYSAPSPFDYKRNTLLYIPDEMPFPKAQSARYVLAVAREVKTLVQATHGHSLILFTSYWMMERVYGMTREGMAKNHPVFLLGKGRADILADFKNSGHGVLFASDAAGEGVDLPGDILSSLIVVKLPFAVPDPIAEHEKAGYPSLHAYQEAVTLPSMLIKLKQYTGRAIRTEGDTAVISILDSRVGRGGRYRAAVLSALFETTVTSQVENVIAFLREKKETGYYE